MMRTRRLFAVWSLVLGVLTSSAGCDDDGDELLFKDVVERQMLTVGGGGPDVTVEIGRGRGKVVTLIIPGDVAPTRATVTVSLVTGVTRRGQAPVNEYGVLVEPEGLAFARPVRVQQRVPPPPAGRHYVAVVVPDKGTAFVARTPARLVGPADPTSGETGELWEGDGDGSGLWGLGLVDGPAPDAGASSVDGGVADAGTTD